MLFVAVFALLAASALAAPQPQYYSYSPAVGSGAGASYSLSGNGRITAVRVWERPSSYIFGFQLRFGGIWSGIAGRKYNQPTEIELLDGEAIVQISGKYGHYLQTVIFVTNKGRMLMAGQPAGSSFNMYPTHPDAELSLISGRFHGAITSIGAHWAIMTPSNSTAAH